MGMTRKKFLPSEKFNKNSKKYHSPFGPAGLVDGRTFKRDPRSGALVFNPLPEDMSHPEMVHHEREERMMENNRLQEELDKTRFEMDELKVMVETLMKPKTVSKRRLHKRGNK